MIINIFVVINKTNNHKAKLYNHYTYTKIFKKNFLLLASQIIRMSENSINLNNKKVKISDLYKNKNIFNIDDIDVNEIIRPFFCKTSTND